MTPPVHPRSPAPPRGDRRQGTARSPARRPCCRSRSPAPRAKRARGRLFLRRDDPHHAGGLRDREVEVRTRHRVRGTLDLVDLVGPPRVQTHRSIAALTPRLGSSAPASRSSCSNWPRRPSISSATRYRIWARMKAVFAAHPGWAARAARTASRSPCATRGMPTRGSPSASNTLYERPDSLRGSLPMNSFAVRRTGRRSSVMTYRSLWPAPEV